MSKFLSKRFADLEPYVPGEQPRDKAYVKLNTNESPYPPSKAVIDALTESEISNLNLYSDPTVTVFRLSVADYYNRQLAKNGAGFELSADNVFPVNGSDEALAFIFQAFCDKDKGMACPSVGYGCYPVFCGVQGIPFKPVPVNADFSVNTALFNGITHNITIANPNAQTGLFLPLARIEELLAENPDRLVVIDEAYCDFGGESAVKLLNSYDNLIVVQTLSKSRQLAGARVGFALASEQIVADLNAMRFSFNPYNVNRLSTIAAAKAMEDENYFEQTRAEIIATREDAKKRLISLGFEVTDSLSNFVLATRCDIGGKELYLKLKEKGVLVRFLSDVPLRNSVRITIGSKAQMSVLFEKIEEILKEKGL